MNKEINDIIMLIKELKIIGKQKVINKNNEKLINIEKHMD